jgi:hypothetical protein
LDLSGLDHREYLPELARVRAQREATLQKQKEDSTTRMLADLAVDRASDPNFAARDSWNPDEEEEEDDGGELNIIDRSAFIVLFRLRSVCHTTACVPKESPAARRMTGVDVACSVYPLLASMADLIVHGRSEEGMPHLCYCGFFYHFVFKIAPDAVLMSIAGEEPWPGQYIDLTQPRPSESTWPRPG